MKALLSEATANRQFAYMCVCGGEGRGGKGVFWWKMKNYCFGTFLLFNSYGHLDPELIKLFYLYHGKKATVPH